MAGPKTQNKKKTMKQKFGKFGLQELENLLTYTSKTSVVYVSRLVCHFASPGPETAPLLVTRGYMNKSIWKKILHGTYGSLAIKSGLISCPLEIPFKMVQVGHIYIKRPLECCHGDNPPSPKPSFVY
jgi:hypothetical protein